MATNSDRVEKSVPGLLRSERVWREAFWNARLDRLEEILAAPKETGTMDIEVNVQERVLKPVNEVFAAIIDPAKMSHYFISSSSGPMKAGTTLEWEFADVGAKVSANVLEIEENRKIVFDWAAGGPTPARVTIRLSADDPNITVVTINEGKFPMDQAGVKRAMGQTAGWTYTLACLKAYLQFGINLRLGLKKRITDV